MRRTFGGLAVLLVVLVVAQFVFAATGAVAGSADGGPREEAYRPHHALGPVIFLVPLVMAVVAAVGRMGGRAIWLPVLVAALTGGQVLLAEGGKAFGDGSAGGQAVFGVHAVNGLAILAICVLLVRSGRHQVITVPSR